MTPASRPKESAAATGTAPLVVRARPEVIAEVLRSLPVAPRRLDLEVTVTVPRALARTERPRAATVVPPSMPARVVRSTPTRAMPAPAPAMLASARAVASVRLAARRLSRPPVTTELEPVILAIEVLPSRTVAVAASLAASVWAALPSAVALPLTVEDDTSEIPPSARRTESVTTTVAVELPWTAAFSPLAE